MAQKVVAATEGESALGATAFSAMMITDQYIYQLDENVLIIQRRKKRVRRCRKGRVRTSRARNRKVKMSGRKGKKVRAW